MHFSYDFAEHNNHFKLFVVFAQDNGLCSQSSTEDTTNSALRPTNEELCALSNIAEHLKAKLAVSSGAHFDEVSANPTGENVDLDNLFAFLSEVNADGGKNAALEEIENQMTELATGFDQEIMLAKSPIKYAIFF